MRPARLVASLLWPLVMCACTSPGGGDEGSSTDGSGIGDRRVRTPAQVITNTSDPKYAVRNFQGIPSIQRAGGRTWAAWYGDSVRGAEGPGNFVVVASSDDSGRNWAERFYLAYENTANRAFDPQLWEAPDGALWVLYTASGSDLTFDGIFGAFIAVIDDPASDAVIVSRRIRLADGVPGTPVRLRSGQILLPIDYWRNPAPRDPGKAGRNIFEIDPNTLKAEHIGTIPDSPDVTFFDETSIAECADGSLFGLVRTREGLHETRSMDAGRTWTNATKFMHFVTPDSRAQVRSTRNGELVLAFNNAPFRFNLSVSISSDCANTWGSPSLIDSRSVTSYPQIEFLEGNELAVIYDRNRSSDREILIGFVDKTDVANNSARPTISVISDQ